MRTGDAAVTAVGLAALVAMPVAGLVAGHLGDALMPLPNSAAYLLVGAYAAWRRPGHRAARWLLRWGAATAVAYGWAAVYSAVVTVGETPSWGWLALEALHVLTWLAAGASLVFFATFPDGRFRTRVDAAIARTVLWLLPAAIIVEVLGAPLIIETDFVWGAGLQAANPLAVPALAAAGTAAMWAVRLVTPIALLIGAALLLVRWAKSDAADRRRIQWPLAAGLAAGILMLALGALSQLVPTLPSWLELLLFLPLVFLIPAGVLVGMLWYDLFDLGVVVRRSLLYVGLWIVIAAGFAIVATVAGVVAARSLPLGVAAATTVVAVVLAAVGRHRLTRLADRVVFGRTADTGALMDAVAEPSSADPGGSAQALAEAVRMGIRARWVTVRMHGEHAESLAPGNARADEDAATLRVTLRVGDVQPAGASDGSPAVLDEVACGPRETGRYSARDRELLEALTRLAALSLANVGLSGELAERVDELQASRVRILRAEEAGRRRLERDLHDGVQQDLVALLARLGLAGNRLRRGSELTAQTVAEAHEDARRALEDLQELVSGLHPTVLSDRGLVAAIESRASRLPLPVTVDADPASRALTLPADAADAVYFAVSESLTNVVKHAGARAARVRLRCNGGAVLEVSVADDGRGMPGAAETRGTGIVGLRDRLDALGGRAEIAAGPDGGTIVTLYVPVATAPRQLTEAADA
jgi:signal transduction histidine kinase